MIHFKIIETSSSYPDVLLYRGRDEELVEIVTIFACGIVGDTENVFSSETVSFESPYTAMAFISGFDQTSAETWCKVNEIFYW